MDSSTKDTTENDIAQATKDYSDVNHMTESAHSGRYVTIRMTRVPSQQANQRWLDGPHIEIRGIRFSVLTDRRSLHTDRALCRGASSNVTTKASRASYVRMGIECYLACRALLSCPRLFVSQVFCDCLVVTVNSLSSSR